MSKMHPSTALLMCQSLQLNYSNPRLYRSSTSLVVSSLHVYMNQTVELKLKV